MKVLEGRVVGNNLRCRWPTGRPAEEIDYNVKTSSLEFKTVDELSQILYVEVDGFLPIGAKVKMTLEWE